MKSLLCVATIVLLCSLAAADHKCGPNQHWANCEGFCSYDCVNGGVICQPICFTGCLCNLGYVKDKSGKCVKQDCNKPIET